VNNTLCDLGKFRTEVYSNLLLKFPAELNTYIETARLNPNLDADAIRIIKYYNKIYQSRSLEVSARR